MDDWLPQVQCRSPTFGRPPYESGIIYTIGFNPTVPGLGFELKAQIIGRMRMYNKWVKRAVDYGEYE